MCRDLSNYDKEIFCNLLTVTDWSQFDVMDVPDIKWNTLYDRVNDILSVMCSFKRYRQREKVTPWLTAVVYRAMRDRDRYVSLFRVTGSQYYLPLMRSSRNKVNQLVHSAKATFIRNQLNLNSNNPKKFWRVVDGLINPAKRTSFTTRFYDSSKNEYVPSGSESEFLNEYCVNIVKNLGIEKSNEDCNNVCDVDTVFTFVDNMPSLDEFIKIIGKIDVSKSSCVLNVNTRFC